MVQGLVMRRYLAAMILVLVLVGLAVVIAPIMFSESLYTGRGTLAYWLTIHSDVIEQFPLTGLKGEVTYFYSCGDGGKPPANGLLFQSTSDRQTLIQTVDSYLAGCGYTKGGRRMEQGELVVEYTLGKTILELSLALEEHGGFLVSAFENYYE